MKPTYKQLAEENKRLNKVSEYWHRQYLRRNSNALLLNLEIRTMLKIKFSCVKTGDCAVSYGYKWIDKEGE